MSIKVAAFSQDRGACTGYRIGQPVAKINKLGLADIKTVGLGDDKAQATVEASDVVFLGRAADEKALELIRRMKSFGKKVVFDLDDSMFDVSPFSPHYRQLGIMPVNFESSVSKTVPGWRDGVDGFEVKRNREVRKAFIQILREVDCITTTTPPLGALYARYNDRVRVIPNAIDFDLWVKHPIRRSPDMVRVVYPAGSNHIEDWMFVQPALKRLQDEIPDWRLVLVGVDWKPFWRDLDPSRIDVLPWVDFEAYPLLMNLACADIGICPISEIGFNDCRSSVKWCEYSALGTATVATDYGPYRRDCRNGEDALLAKTSGDWIDALRRLITDEAERKRIAGNAYARVKRDFNLDFVADDWMKVFKEVTG